MKLSDNLSWGNLILPEFSIARPYWKYTHSFLFVEVAFNSSASRLGFICPMIYGLAVQQWIIEQEFLGELMLPAFLKCFHLCWNVNKLNKKEDICTPKNDFRKVCLSFRHGCYVLYTGWRKKYVRNGKERLYGCQWNSYK